MSQNSRSTEPAFSDAERDELGHLQYLDARVDELRARGLIAADAYATIVAESRARRESIELSGRYRRALNQAEKLSRKDPREALHWAEAAQELDPGREQAWDLVVALYWELGDHDAAIARCSAAADRFPRFQAELDRLKLARSKLAEEESRQAERAREDGAIKGWLGQARLALNDGRDADAIALSQQIVALRHDHIDALAIMAFAQQRTGQFDQALTSYGTLAGLQPYNTTWTQWERNLRLRLTAARVTGKAPEPAIKIHAEAEPAGLAHATEVSAPPPPISWSSFAGEFLKEHSQELLLCLAVLLIVVSSTVGAHLLLGDLLWSPVGKCTLAMIATLLFSALGAGLLRWGAVRAGRMMLVATLIVVPIHFMLVGEMHLLHQPSAFRLAFLMIEALALVATVRWVSAMLAPSTGARLLTAALLLLSMGSATTARNSPLAWELQFASFQLSPLVFLGVVGALGSRRWADTSKDHRDFVYMMLGLLGFSLVACLVRTGVYALHLEAALYAVPAMLIAISSVYTARVLVADEPDHQRLALMRLGGYGLSGLAFALTLASAPAATSLSSANILAVSALGLALYVASLRADRHPAFLYLAFGAVAAGRLGAQYFLAGRLQAIEELVRQLLHYPDRLPVPFRAILGVGPNIALAALALWFVRRWDDRRLARHCHYIGLPLSAAACIWSGFEPLAAAICLSLYASLYLLAIWTFAVPWLTYLAAAALAGASYFGSTLVPGITLADQALEASLLGLAFWAARVELRRRRLAPAYHVPWLRAGLVLAGIAMVVATWHLVTVGVGSWTGAGAFAVIAVLAFLLNRERPRAIWAHLALLSFVEFTICALGLAMGVQNLGGYHYGLLFMADGLAMLVIAEVVRHWLGRPAPATSPGQADVVVASHWAGTMLAAIPRSVVVLTFVANAMALLSIERTWLAGLVFLLGSLPLLWTTRLGRYQPLVYLGLAQLVVGVLELASCAAGWNDLPALAGWLALTGASLGLALWAAAIGSRRLGLSTFYTEPCFQTAFVLAGASVIGANGHIASAGIGSWVGAGAFVVTAGLAFLINRERPLAAWAYLTLLCFVECSICGLGLSFNGRQLGAHHLGLLLMADGLALLAAAEALRSWLNRAAVQAGADQAGGAVDSRWAGTFLAAIPASAIVLTFAANAMAFLSIERTWLAGLVFLLGCLPLLGTTRLLRHPALVYLGLAQFAAGTLDLASCASGWNNPPWLAGWLAVTAAILGLVLWGAGTATRRLRLLDFYSEPCFHAAFFLMVGAYVVALEARGLGRAAYGLAAASLGVNVLVTMLLGWTWRRAELTYLAVVHLVTATYVVLLSIGKNDPAMAYVLGLAAVVEAIILWGLGFSCRRARDPWANECARPLDHWSVLLTVAAVVLSDRSSVVLALVGISFLLTVKSLPGAGWLYGTVAAWLAACYLRWLDHVPHIELIGCAMLAAFVLWALGVSIQRHKPTLCQRLGLRSLAYEYPLFHSSILVALAALALRADLSFTNQISWTEHGWFALALGALSLAMLRAYPMRACVHASLAFVTWSVIGAIAPSLTSVCHVGLAGSALAVGLLLIERVVRPREWAICARLGVIDAGYAPVVRGWALVGFGLTVCLAIVIVAGETSGAILGQRLAALALTGVDWWIMLLTLGLIGLFVIALAGELDAWGTLGPEHLVVALHWVGVATLWWLGVGCSPLAGRVIAVGAYYPLATVVAGLAMARVVTRHTHSESWYELAWLGDLRSKSMERLLSIQTCVLTLLAVAFTKGSMEPSTALTLVLASLTLGLVASATGWLAAVFAGSIAWSAGWAVTGLVVAQRLGWAAAGVRATCASAGGLAAAFTLFTLAGWLRRQPSLLKNQSSRTSSDGRALALPSAYAIEMVAFAVSLVAVVMVLAAGVAMQAPGGLWTAAGVVVILGAALLHVLLVPRWQAEWLVYLAQTVMLAAYVNYRLAFPQPLAFDAMILTALGYLDLGIAEVLERLERKTYARPVRFFSLLIPGLPLLQLIGGRQLDEVGLFHLMAAGTFYGIACGRLRWKTLGYAAALLYNAALWVLWSRLGWTLSSHPQFFLVPVGLSTILFAEVNRRDLGRANVNSIRTVGLTIVYLSLAVPIWQYESFGAWVALLIGSLFGVFVGIGLRLQTFLWMGLTTFVLDVLYEMGRVSLDYALAKWAIMLALGIALVLFVALNEKKRIVSTMWLYFDQARSWE